MTSKHNNSQPYLKLACDKQNWDQTGMLDSKSSFSLHFVFDTLNKLRQHCIDTRINK